MQPALTKVFDVALAGGGAKSINFQELAADLAEITFGKFFSLSSCATFVIKNLVGLSIVSDCNCLEFPFRIPPYFALVIRAISVLEGIALVGQPDFAIVDEAFPYIARRLLTDKSPRLRAALRYMVSLECDTRHVDLYEPFCVCTTPLSRRSTNCQRFTGVKESSMLRS